jgi:hypothetical protein
MSKKINLYLVLLLVVANLILLKLVLMPGSPLKSKPDISSSSTISGIVSQCGTTITTLLRTQMEYNGRVIPKNLSLISSDGSKHIVSNLGRNLPVIIADFRRSSCSICVEKEIERLQKLSNRIGKESIILLLPFNSERNRRAFEAKYHINTYDVVHADNLEMPDIGVPYVFILDKSFRIRDIHLLSSEYPITTTNYYSLIIQKYY